MAIDRRENKVVHRVRKKLPRSFYNRPTLDVARDLLGKHLVFAAESGRLSARIVETEAYIGQGDPACHAARGKTARNAVMFGPPGFSYIYFIYGMYYCLNFVTEPANQPAAVLIRAAEPVEGVEPMLATGRNQKPQTVLSGPGKLCRAFGLTRDHSGLDLTAGGLFVEDGGEAPTRVVETVRIGINVGADLPWRFYDADSKSVSKPR
ncbi:DNA-3-methyladenine glycosylase [candidate division GN15 bacterium]|nr:DNA-3-methyladenine glycosylase [candidate division GN15 bacterium]